jgi:hypothetical protein
MAPYELKDLTVSQLGKIRNSMSTPGYLWALQKLPVEKRHESALLLHQVQIAHLMLRAAELSSIRDQLTALEPELIDGADALQQVLADLKKAEEIMAVVSGFLALVGRIVTLI